MYENSKVITNISKRSSLKNPERGDIYYADLSGIEQSIGCEQKGRRPVLVIQNDIGNKHSSTTIVAILTTKMKKNLPTHVVLKNVADLKQTSTVCVEQIKTIDKSRLEDYLGNVGEDTMCQIDKAISISLGIGKINESNWNLLDQLYTEEEKNNMDIKPSQTLYDDQNIDWLQMAESQFQFFTYAEQHVANLKYKRDEVEQEIENILTYIENTNFNASQGYKVYKLIRDKQVVRKAIMQEIELLESMLENLNCDMLLKAYQSSVITMKSVKRKYEAPKEMKEIMDIAV